MRKTRLFSILALLLMAATGAWAQTETLLTTITPTAKEQASYSTANVATVSFSYTAYGSSAYLANWGWWGYGWSATVTAAEGFTITKCIFYDDADRTATDSEAPFVVETTEEDKTPRINGTPIDGGNMWSKGIKKIEVYGYATYSVTLAEGTEDAKNWTISPAEAAEGSPVTATYSGEKKVKSVKAVKKAPAGPTASTLAESTVGMIVGTDGKAYAVADKDNLPSGVTAVAMVAYKNGSNGLAIQLNDISVKMKWSNAKTYVEDLDAVSGGTWRLPSKDDWQNMFVGCAVSGDATVPDANNQMNPIAGFKAKIAATGITWQTRNYWTSTGGDSSAWLVGVNLGDSSTSASFLEGPHTLQMYVRACLAF